MAPLAAAALLLAAATTLTLASKIPDAWGRCKRTDPQLDNCIKDAMQRAIPDLKGGSKRFGVFPIDPFKVEKVQMEQGGTSSIRINMTFSDCEIRGLGSSRVESVKSDLENYKIAAVLSTSKLTLLSRYAVIGQVLVIPINGHGRCTVAMENVQMQMDIEGSPITGKDGKTHMQIDKLNLIVVPESSRFDFVNPDHAQQASLLSRVVTENDRVIMQDLQPAISEAFSIAIKEAANRIFAKAPFDEVFLPQ